MGFIIIFYDYDPDANADHVVGLAKKLYRFGHEVLAYKVVKMMGRAEAVVLCLSSTFEDNAQCRTITQRATSDSNKTAISGDVYFVTMVGGYNFTCRNIGWLNRAMKGAVCHPAWSSAHVASTAKTISSLVHMQARTFQLSELGKVRSPSNYSIKGSTLQSSQYFDPAMHAGRSPCRSPSRIPSTSTARGFRMATTNYSDSKQPSPHMDRLQQHDSIRMTSGTHLAAEADEWITREELLRSEFGGISVSDGRRHRVAKRVEFADDIDLRTELHEKLEESDVEYFYDGHPINATHLGAIEDDV